MSKSSKGQAWGLDLCGYHKKAALAFAKEERREIKVTLYEGHPFSMTRTDWDEVPHQREIEFINKQIESTPLYVDCPIDLQGLANATNKKYKWQLDKRPIDQALGGLAPLATYVGALVSRFRLLLPTDRFGTRVFETYPAGSLKLWGRQRNFGQEGESYKGYRIQWEGKEWAAMKGKNEKKHAKAAQLAKIVNKVGIRPCGPTPNEETLNHDELDAILCALAGLRRLSDGELRDQMKERLLKKIEQKRSGTLKKTRNRNEKETARNKLESEFNLAIDIINQFTLPKGYRLCDLAKLKKEKKKIIIKREDWPPEG
ncbi:DUF429 domain-containing protein [bacterium]|nr:DUF429 domain-containing protein [bacterium]